MRSNKTETSSDQYFHLKRLLKFSCKLQKITAEIYRKLIFGKKLKCRNQILQLQSLGG